METHQRIAVLIWLTVAAYVFWRDPRQEALAKAFLLFVFIAPIIFYRVIAWLSGFGFPEYFARDFGPDPHPGPYAFFFWMLFLIASAFLLFDWSLF